MIDITEFIPEFKFIPIICGPTASGKSSLAFELCKKLDAELISCDSMQMYKHFDIGTAKPTKTEQEQVVHHMIDIVEPGQFYSVSEFVHQCEKEIDSVLRRGKLPVICGGTGQYVSALCYGIDYEANLDSEKISQKVDELTLEYESDGIDGIYLRLQKVDNEASLKIHKNNTRRVLRALATFEATGVTFTQKNLESKKSGPKYPYKLFQIDVDRSDLYDKINKRVDIMIQDGLVDEVKSINQMNIDPKSTCMQAIGYKEIVKYLNNEISLDRAIYEIKLNSRHYAKRQLTWYRYMDCINLLKVTSKSLQIQDVLNQIK